MYQTYFTNKQKNKIYLLLNFQVYTYLGSYQNYSKPPIIILLINQKTIILTLQDIN